jgi:hypothetical protein
MGKVNTLPFYHMFSGSSPSSFNWDFAADRWFHLELKNTFGASWDPIVPGIEDDRLVLLDRKTLKLFLPSR